MIELSRAGTRAEAACIPCVVIALLAYWLRKGGRKLFQRAQQIFGFRFGILEEHVFTPFETRRVATIEIE